jgi:hypothetical protein
MFERVHEEDGIRGMRVPSERLRRSSTVGWPALATLAVGAAYIAWSAKFIERASFLALDRTRYWGIFDDALISMRYAWNFSHGQGPVWNPGEHVEGYSNPLTMLIMALACAIFDRGTACLAMAILGIGTVLAAAYGVARLATRFESRPASDSSAVAGPPRALIFAVALAFYPLSYWSLSGMETGMVSLLFIVALLAVERWGETGSQRYQTACWIALGLLCVARPDGVLLALLGGLAFAHAAWVRHRVSAPKRILLVAGMALILPAAQLIFRLVYYGSAFPNTGLLKLGGFPLVDRLRGGLAFIRPFLGSTLALALPIGVGLWRRPSRLKWVALIALLTLLAYQIVVGGDPWPYWRIMAPAIPLSASVAAHTIWAILSPRVVSRSERVVLHAGRIAVLGLLLLTLNWRFLREAAFDHRPYGWEANVANRNVALALSEVTSSGASVGVFWAGSIPYYTGLRAVDFLGKSDPVIARMAPDLTGAVAWNGMTSVPGHNKYDLNYSIVKLRPTYVQGFRWGRQDLSEWGRAHYDSVSHRGITLWLRRGAPEVRRERIHP